MRTNDFGIVLARLSYRLDGQQAFVRFAIDFHYVENAFTAHSHGKLALFMLSTEVVVCGSDWDV